MFSTNNKLSTQNPNKILHKKLGQCSSAHDKYDMMTKEHST